MYIGLTKQYTIPYYCQKCTISGIVGMGFLKDMKVYDNQLINAIEKSNKKAKFKNSKEKTGQSFSFKKEVTKKKLKLPLFSGKKKEIAKYNYLDGRFSFSLDPDEYIAKYKTIFSFQNFVEENEIEEFTTNDWMLSQLSKNYVGFLSADQSYIIFRNIDPNCDKHHRYFMYNIFGDETGKRFYTTRCKANILSPDVKLVLAEGPFDIIGISEYFYKDQDNVILTAVNGKGYNLICNHFARLGFLDLDISIYSDSDVNIGMYRNLKKKSPCLANNPVRVYYNTLEKDYGTTEDRINLTSNKI
jgi:hypothetical protein